MTKWIIKLIPKFIKTWFLNLLYDDIASKGINGDTELAYLNKQQQSFLKSIGGSGTLNPYTGCKQYFGPLAIGLAVGTAAFGIAKLAGLSTKKALGIGLLGGLGAGGIKALMAAPTATGVSNATVGLAEAAGAGSTAAGQAASQLGASYGAGTSAILGPSGSAIATPGSLGAGVSGTIVPELAGTGINTMATRGLPLSSPGTFTAVKDASGAVKSIIRPDLVSAPESPISQGASAVGQFVKDNPGATIGGLTFLGSLASQPKVPANQQMEEPYTEEEYRQAYARQRARTEPFSDRAVYERDEDSLTPENVYERQEMLYANEGGLASFREGGVNYLPSKSDHDEKDANNYVRATGYVEDGSGNGDKDEDTMLAQLADGEFVSRADAVLGAGIMQGANPEDFKDMRRKGAQFFYKQQDQFKRIYDIVNDGNKTS